MKPDVFYPQANITHLGAFARSCLTPGRRGRVLAAFSKAVYLVTAEGDLFWITGEGAPMHQRCATVSSFPVGLRTNDQFHTGGHQRMIEPSLSFDIQGASDWVAPRLDPRGVLDSSELPRRVLAFFSDLDISQARGLGSLIPQILRLPQNPSPCPLREPADPILRLARPLVLGMARACLEHQPDGMVQNADALIGLGAGLTPSGDDFLGGLLFALDVLRRAYPASIFAGQPIPIEPYRWRTHLISFTLLKDLAGGRAIEPLHRFINALLGGESFEVIHLFVSQLTRVGHSTGWDLLTGTLAGLLFAFRGSHSSPSFQEIRAIQV
jgi:uncharacterized protein DUF2877